MTLHPPQRVLCIIVSRIGDTLLCTPALRALKETWPNCRLTVMAHPGRMPLLAGLGEIDELRPFSRWHRLAGRLPLSSAYDLALVFSPDLAQIRYAARRAKNVVCFAGKNVVLPGKVMAVPLPGEKMVAVEERLLLPRAAGANTANHRLAYCVFPEERAWSKRWLQARGGDAGALVALQLRSFPTKSHRDWPLASFSELVGRLLAEHPGLNFVVLGDENSREDGGRLAQAYPGKVMVAAGELSLRQTAAVLSGCALYIGVDTGPTHLCGALGIPMVALYHAAYPGRYLAPRQHPACRIIEHPGCGSDPKAASMADIPVGEVFQAAHALLSEAPLSVGKAA